MAYVTECVYCERNSLNGPHPECIEAFRDKILGEIIRHARQNPNKPLPARLVKLLQGQLTEEVLDYWKAVEKNQKIMARAAKMQELLQPLVLKCAEALLKEHRLPDDDIEIGVDVSCQRAMRC
jgi:hypothetical protein